MTQNEPINQLIERYREANVDGYKTFANLIEDEELAQSLNQIVKSIGWLTFRKIALETRLNPTLNCIECGKPLSRAAIIRADVKCSKCNGAINPSNRVAQPANFKAVSGRIEIPPKLVDLISRYHSAALIAKIAASEFVNWFKDHKVTVKTACWAVHVRKSTVIEPTYCRNCGTQLLESQYVSKSEYCSIKCSTTKYAIEQPPKTAILTTPVTIPPIFAQLYRQSYCPNLSKAHSRTLYKLLIDAGYRNWFKDNNVSVQVVFDALMAGNNTVQPQICTTCGRFLTIQAIENHSTTCTTHIVTKPVAQQYKKCGLNRQPDSAKEFQLIEMVNRLIPNERIEYNKRKPLANKFELDIWIPDRRVAIEFNGQYYHSTAFDRITETYHQQKSDAAKRAGIKLVHVFEWMWDHSNWLVERLIKDLLRLDVVTIDVDSIDGREISLNEYNQFAVNRLFEDVEEVVYAVGLFDRHTTTMIAAGGWNKQDQLVRVVTSDGIQIADVVPLLGRASKYDRFELIVNRAYHDWVDFGLPLVRYDNPHYRYVNGPVIRLPNQPRDQSAKWYKVYDCGYAVYQLTQ